MLDYREGRGIIKVGLFSNVLALYYLYYISNYIIYINFVSY